ncbi:MAG TPA: helix-turn-helix transcriptional regulator [Bacteriovoracaceae bacterium]|nr:helix-turn-helix transcriptional regulator [Bacteriovoracaceae bacterium]
MNDLIPSIGPIMKAARKFKKFNQADVAHAIGCSQSALSKMEHNLLIPSAPQWFLFSRFTAIPPETLERGFIDRHTRVKFNNDQVSLGFKLPKKYRHFRGEKIREVYPFLQYLDKQYSPAAMKEFTDSTDLDPEFFLDFDNLTNYQLLVDTIEFFIKLGRNTPGDIEALVMAGQNDIYWDHFGIEWAKLKDIPELLSAYVNEQPFFQSDFQLKLEERDKDLVLTYYPEYHLKQFASTVSVPFTEFLNLYRKFTIENLVKRVLNLKIIAELLPDVQTATLGAKFLISEVQ